VSWLPSALDLWRAACLSKHMLPDPIQDLIVALERLPGIGPKTASRLAFFLLRAPEEIARQLEEALKDIKGKISLCEECFNITNAGRGRCEICESSQRDGSMICVVEEPLDVLALERMGAYKGKYHVLQGVLSPIEGIGPDNLKIKPLLDRVQRGGVKEIILATNPSMEGEATAQYLHQQLQTLGVQITRLARGLPVGGDLEYADQNTLLRALMGRQEMS
jgi:recombination protein RecR